jgi:hypothetical protein
MTNVSSGRIDGKNLKQEVQRRPVLNSSLILFNMELPFNVFLSSGCRTVISSIFTRGAHTAGHFTVYSHITMYKYHTARAC